MRATCPSCQTHYNIDDKRIPPGGAKLKCARCQTLFAAKGPPSSDAVPLPGSPAPAAGEHPGPVPLPSPSPARAAAIPLPGGPGRVAKFEEGLSSIPLPGSSNLRPIQLPGLTGIEDDLDLAFARAAPEPAGNGPAEMGIFPADSVPGTPAGAEAAVEPPAASDVDISSLETSALPEPDLHFDFDLAPSPTPAPAAQAAPAAAPPPAALDAPAEDLNFELTEAPSTEALTPSEASDIFDLGGPTPPASPPGAEAAPSPAGPGADENSFAVNAAEPPHSEPRAGGESLELLTFADDRQGPPAGEKATAPRYHLRRKTGKVLGPFEQPAIARMLRGGQLEGTEDVSSDAAQWSPIASVPAFRDAIAAATRAPAAEDDRLKRLYEGRMAAVNVTRSNSFRDVLRQRAGLLIAAAAAIAIVGAGASLGFTRYGAFGLRKLFSTHVPRGSAQFVMLQNARRGFLADTYKSHREANELAAAVLKVRDYPEARAVWCQSVYYLHRAFNAAKPGDMLKANAALEDIELLGRRDLDYVKAIAGARLADNSAAAALPVLQEAAARNENAGDLELALLLAEAYGRQGQSRLAIEALTKAIDRHQRSARALHALGRLHQAANEPEKAAKAFSGALEADPDHLSSAVELAAIDLLSRNDPGKALQSLGLADSDKGQTILGPTEMARARALKGAALQAQSKNPEAMAELEQALKLDPTSAFAKDHLAHLLLIRHEFDKALPLYKDVVDKDPQNLGATEGYLSSLIGAAKMDDALTAVAQANARFPGKAQIAYLDGRVNDALDKADEAEKHYKRAINADPKLIDAALYLSRLYLRFRRAAEAKAQLEQALAQAPADARVRAAIGELAMLEDDLPRARAELQKAVQLDAKLPEAHLGLGKLALADGALETAQREVERALELDPHVPDGRYQHGIVLWRARLLDEALAELEKARAEDPKSVRLSIALGAVLLDKADLPRAEATLLGALAVDPINPEGHFYLAKVKNRRGEYSQAIDSMRNALDRAPQRPEYHYEMGVIYRDAKRANEAIQEWKRAVELDKSQADSLEALGQAYLDRGGFDDAVEFFEQALGADRRRTRVLAQIGDCFFQAAKWDRAIAAYSSALKADGSLKQVFYKLGRAYTEKGQHAQAIGWYRKAVASEPDKAMAYYYLGFAYKEKHNKKDAIEAFRVYLALKTDAEDKRDIEDEIYDLQHD